MNARVVTLTENEFLDRGKDIDTKGDFDLVLLEPEPAGDRLSHLHFGWLRLGLDWNMEIFCFF